MRRRWSICWASACALLPAVISAQPLTVLSTDNDPGDPRATATGSSRPTGMSGDGRYVVFTSDAKDVIAGQSGQFQQLFLFDHVTGSKTMISHAAGDATAGASSVSSEGRMSRNGRWVVFESSATNLIPGQVDVGTDADVFLWDRVTGTTTLVSHIPGSSLTAGDDRSFDATLSADGRFVAYQSQASDLVPGQVGSGGTFLYDRTTNENVAASHATSGTNEVRSGSPLRLSADGAWVYFASDAADLVAGYSGSGDIYLFERASGAVSLVSHAFGMPFVGQNSVGGDFVASADGNYALYSTFSTNLVAAFNDGNGPLDRDVFLWDRASDVWTLVTVSGSGSGASANDDSTPVAMSADGGYGVLRSDATDLVTGASDTNAAPDVFLYDRLAGTRTLVSHAAGMPLVAADSVSDGPVLSARGRFVAYTSAAGNLVSGMLKTNGAFDRDVFLFDRTSGDHRLVDRIAASATTTGNAPAADPQVSDNGTVVLSSQASDLVADDLNNSSDVFSNSTLLFADGFESGDPAAWSGAIP